MITRTYGASGTYASFGAVWNSIPATLADSYTLIQVGASVDAGDVISPHAQIDLNGHSILFTSSVPHNGDPTIGYESVVGGFCELDWTGTGNVTFDDFFLKANGVVWLGSANNFQVTGTANVFLVKNSCIRSDTQYVRINGINALGANRWACHLVNSKLVGLSRALYFRPFSFGGGAQGQTRFIMENCAGKNLAGTAASLFEIDGILEILTIRNCVGYLFSAANQSLIKIDLVSFGATYVSEQNARSAGLNNGITGIPYTAITVPADILSLSDLDPDFLDTNPSSVLATNGAVPELAENPYTVAPYPIGVYYPPSPPPAVSGGLWMPAFVGSL